VERIFKKLNIEVPETWDEWLKVCKKIQDAGLIPIAIGGDASSFWAGDMGWLVRLLNDAYLRNLIGIMNLHGTRIINITRQMFMPTFSSRIIKKECLMLSLMTHSIFHLRNSDKFTLDLKNYQNTFSRGLWVLVQAVRFSSSISSARLCAFSEALL